jgi:hypothetical protein
VSNRWDDFLETMKGRTDEEGVFNTVKDYMRGGWFNLESNHACAEVYSRTLGILHNEDFNSWQQASRRYVDQHPPAFEFMQYNSEVLRRIEKIQEAYAPEQEFTGHLCLALAAKCKELGIHGSGGGQFSETSWSYKGRRYKITVRDETYEWVLFDINLLESLMAKGFPSFPGKTEEETKAKAMAKLEKLKEQLSHLRPRP